MPPGSPLTLGNPTNSYILQRMSNIGIPTGFSPVLPQQNMHRKQSPIQGKKIGEGRKKTKTQFCVKNDISI